MGTLFAMFCECAELNPDPIEGNDYLLNRHIDDNFSFVYMCISSRLITSLLLSAEEEVEHNWVFSADQLEDNAGGILLYLMSFSYLSFNVPQSSCTHFLFTLAPQRMVMIQNGLSPKTQPIQSESMVIMTWLIRLSRY